MPISRATGKTGMICNNQDWVAVEHYSLFTSLIKPWWGETEVNKLSANINAADCSWILVY